MFNVCVFNQLKQSTTPCGVSDELELKEHHTYCILEKLTNRLHLHGKPVHVHSNNTLGLQS